MRLTRGGVRPRGAGREAARQRGRGRGELPLRPQGRRRRGLPDRPTAGASASPSRASRCRGRRHDLVLDLRPLLRRRRRRGSAAAARSGGEHRVDGMVVRGDQRGREIGYPTANLEPLPWSAVPADGIYAGRLVRGKELLPPRSASAPTRRSRATSVASRPSSSTSTADLYGEHVGRRSPRDCATPSVRRGRSLVAQMHLDVDHYPGPAVSPGGVSRPRSATMLLAETPD